MKYYLMLALCVLVISTCKENPTEPDMPRCERIEALEGISIREFNMGFSTWSYGPDISDKDDTYSFLAQYGDIYSEQVDDRLPWQSWINGTELPSEFVSDVDDRVNRRINSNKLVLSVSLLNSGRTELINDFDGSVPQYNALNDVHIRNAYIMHLRYLIDRLEPDYLVAAMEVNELYVNAGPDAWTEYTYLMNAVRDSLNISHPDLKISESVTLHNWLDLEEAAANFDSELTAYINQLDFAAISFYPLFKNMHSYDEFTSAFNYLNSRVNVPVSFVETTHLANDLVLESFDVTITSNECEQDLYLQALAKNAFENEYEFFIWWTHRDYDELWETFPDEVKDLGKIWRDTGLLDEDGNERPVYDTWEFLFEKSE